MNCRHCNPPPPRPPVTLSGWFEYLRSKPSDFDGHMDTLKGLADGCDHVSVVSTWLKPALPALCGSSAKVVVWYSDGRHPYYPSWEWLVRREGRELIHRQPGDEFAETDLLFLDTGHNAAEVGEGLARYAPKVRRYVVLHCTTIYGEIGDDGAPWERVGYGVMSGVRGFREKNPSWREVLRHEHNNGLLVLGRVRPEDVAGSAGEANSG